MNGTAGVQRNDWPNQSFISFDVPTAVQPDTSYEVRRYIQYSDLDPEQIKAFCQTVGRPSSYAVRFSICQLLAGLRYYKTDYNYVLVADTDLKFLIETR